MSADKEQINVLIAVSNNVLSEGLRKVSAEDAQINAFAAGNGSSSLKPDVILFDVNQDQQRLQRSYPEAKPILLDTGLKEQEIAYLLVCHKVRGIISPEASIELFHKAIKVVNSGEIWIDQKHLKSVLLRSGAMTEHEDINGLSSQDKTIVKLISQGRKNREIGEKLCLSEHTIKAHVSRIFRRLNVSNRAQLVGLAKEHFADLH